MLRWDVATGHASSQDPGDRRLHPASAVESLPDDVSVTGVPSGLLYQVKQHPAQVAVDDVGPGAGVLKLHARRYVTRHLYCGFVAIYPLLDRFPVVN
jgi:hypothetical protein